MKNISQNIPAVVFLLYLLVNVYVAAFNWEVFSTVLNIELGFGKMAMPPFIVLFFFGLVLFLALWFFEYRRDIKNQIRHIEEKAEITNLKKDLEIAKLKSQKIQQVVLDTPTGENNKTVGSKTKTEETKSPEE